MQRVMFYCQHVFGIGHLVRSAELVRALAERFEVLLVVGGEIPEGFPFPANVELLRLRALKATPGYSGLELCDPVMGLAEAREERRTHLLEAFDRFRPDALVTELFPFGRRQFAFELIPLLERARAAAPAPLVVSSVRDVLVTKADQAAHERAVTRLVNDYFDLVLVHGDERFLRLDDTFASIGALRCPVEYTGYVARLQPPPAEALAASEPAAASARDGLPAGDARDASRPAIIVASIGSGASEGGHQLLESVVRAAPLLDPALAVELRIFAGPLMPADAYRRLERLAAGRRGVRLSRYTPDLPGELRRARLSISMGGYNTIMDVLAAGIPALVHPVGDAGDQEQAQRAARLARSGVLSVIGPEQLEPRELSAQIRRALLARPHPIRLDLAGAAKTRASIERHLQQRAPAVARAAR